MSVMLFSRKRTSSPVICTIIRSFCMSSNNKNVSASAPPPPGSLVLPSRFKVTKLPDWHPAEFNNPEEWEPYHRMMEYVDDLTPIESLKKYYDAWRQYILQSKSGWGCGSHLPLSKILLRRPHEYMDDNPHKAEPSPDRWEPSVEGPSAVLDDFEYFSLGDQRVLYFDWFSTPRRSHRTSLGHWIIIYDDKKIRRFCTCSGEDFYLPKPTLITCHLSSPLFEDVKKMNKDGSGLAFRRFAMTPLSSPPWDNVIMAIDKSHGYLVYTGATQFVHPDCWIVLDSITNYSTGDVLYFNKDASFYVLPDSESGNLEVWSFQNHIFTKTSEMSAELAHNNNSYHHLHSYLVESLNGDLLLVRRYVGGKKVNNSFMTDNFEVFKFNFGSKRWEAVPSLGDDEALFVGSNSSFALSSTKYPGVIPNCIYFSDQLCEHGEENMIHGQDNGIFHLKDGTVTALFYPKRWDHPPTWLCPSAEWWPEHCQQNGGYRGYGQLYRYNL